MSPNPSTEKLWQYVLSQQMPFLQPTKKVQILKQKICTYSKKNLFFNIWRFSFNKLFPIYFLFRIFRMKIFRTGLEVNCSMGLSENKNIQNCTQQLFLLISSINF